jgi:hypothetical protein
MNDFVNHGGSNILLSMLYYITSSNLNYLLTQSLVSGPPVDTTINQVTKQEDFTLTSKEPTPMYRCTFQDCNKSFGYKWALDKHIRTHYFCPKVFKCEYEGCAKTYKSRENLKLHIKNKHLGIKPYECKFCNLRFSHRNGKFKF